MKTEGLTLQHDLRDGVTTDPPARQMYQKSIFCDTIKSRKGVMEDTLHIFDKFGRQVNAKSSGNIMIYSVNDMLTVIVKKDTPIAKVLSILEQMPDE